LSEGKQLARSRELFKISINYMSANQTVLLYIPINTFAATDELSRQLKCIVRCHWRVYSSFSTCISALHRHHRT